MNPRALWIGLGLLAAVFAAAAANASEGDKGTSGPTGVLTAAQQRWAGRLKPSTLALKGDLLEAALRVELPGIVAIRAFQDLDPRGYVAWNARRREQQQLDLERSRTSQTPRTTAPSSTTVPASTLKPGDPVTEAMVNKLVQVGGMNRAFARKMTWRQFQNWMRDSLDPAVRDSNWAKLGAGLLSGTAIMDQILPLATGVVSGMYGKDAGNIVGNIVSGLNDLMKSGSEAGIQKIMLNKIANRTRRQFGDSAMREAR